MIYIGVIGEGICSGEVEKTASEIGAEIAKAGAVLICGGLGGVMEAACRGAKSAGGVTIGILPMGDRVGENPYLSYSIPTGIGEARNSIVVRASDAIISVGGSFGTLTEIAFAVKFGKPVIGIHTWEAIDSMGSVIPLIKADTPGDAVARAISEVQENRK